MMMTWELFDTLKAHLLPVIFVMALLLLVLLRITTKGCSVSLTHFTRSLILIPLMAIGERIKAWIFLISGRDMMLEAYKRCDGAPFHMDIPENRLWLVSSPDQIKEINAAPHSVLSLLGAAKDLLQPKYTMRDFDWMEDKQGTEGATLIKTLRNDLTGHLPGLLPEIRLSMSVLFDQQYESLPLLRGDKHAPILPLVSTAIAQSNAFIFFGKEISQNTQFIKAGISMIEHTVIISDMIRLVPTCISSYVGNFLARRMNSGDLVYDMLEPMVAERFAEKDRAKQGYKVPEHRDCVQWIMENSPKTKPWTVQRVVHELIALWYGSVHITVVSACFALHDLCNNAEYAEPLRNEIENTTWEVFDSAAGRTFPLMDSFLKESTRLNPVECMSARRKALKPFQFNDGTRVEAGQWVCAPLASMSLDSKNYALPDEFHGFRHVQPDVLHKSLTEAFRKDFEIPAGQQSSQFTDITDVPFWGTGKMTCGGRFYASAVIKILLGLFLTKWDMQLAEPKAKQHFAWRSWLYPYASTKAVLRPRHMQT